MVMQYGVVRTKNITHSHTHTCMYMYDSNFLVVVISVGLTLARHNQLCFRNVSVHIHVVELVTTSILRLLITRQNLVEVEYSREGSHVNNRTIIKIPINDFHSPIGGNS